MKEEREKVLDTKALPHLEELVEEKLYTAPDGFKERGNNIMHPQETVIFRTVHAWEGGKDG